MQRIGRDARMRGKRELLELLTGEAGRVADREEIGIDRRGLAHATPVDPGLAPGREPNRARKTKREKDEENSDDDLEGDKHRLLRI